MLGESAGVSTDKRDKRWWKPGLSDDKRRQTVRDVVRQIIKAQVFRKEADLRHARMYANLPILGFGVASYSRPMTMSGSRLAYNVVKSCSDAFTAKLTKDRPKVTFVTQGGDWSLQKKAEQLDQYMEGQFYESDLYETLPLIVLDACIFGTGCLKIYTKFDKGEGEEISSATVAMTRVFPWEIVIDDQEAMYGEPRAIYQRKYYDRLVLMELAKEWNPEDADHIAALLEDTRRDQDDVDGIGFDSTADQILVTEAWHLPSGPNARDGRHCVVVENGLLLDEEYDQDYFPFAFFRRQKPPVGFWGIGLTEELIGIQLEINVLLLKIQRSHHLLAAGHWLVPNGSKINSGKIDNDIGSIIRYTGEKPELETGQTLTKEVYDHLETLYHKAYEVSGISELTAQSEKPPGLNSGKALSTYANIETERFSVSVRALHAFMLEVARQTIDRAREITAVYPDFEVRAQSHQVMKTVRFLDVDLRDEDRILKMFPTNLLAQDPAERIGQLKDLQGFFEPDDIRRLMDFPDTKSVADYANASYELVQTIIEEFKTAESPEYIGPEPFMNLEDGIKRMQLAYLVAKTNRVPEDRLELFRQWMADAHDLLSPPPAPPPAPAPGAPVTGGPPTMGAPPPPNATMPASANMAMGGPPAPGGPPPGPPPLPPIVPPVAA